MRLFPCAEEEAVTQAMPSETTADANNFVEIFMRRSPETPNRVLLRAVSGSG
jgi:hypothetical protein